MRQSHYDLGMVVDSSVLAVSHLLFMKLAVIYILMATFLPLLGLGLVSRPAHEIFELGPQSFDGAEFISHLQSGLINRPGKERRVGNLLR